MSAFISKLYELIIFPDSIGPTPTLTHKGNARYKTLLGSFLTLSLLVICVLANVVELEDTIYGWNPTIDSVEYRSCCDSDFDYAASTHMKLHFQIEYYNETSNSFQSINIIDLPKIAIFKYIDGVESPLNGMFGGFLNEVSYLTSCSPGFFANYSQYYDYFYNKEYIPRNHDNWIYNYTLFGNHSYSLAELKDFETSSLCFPSYLNETLVNSKQNSTTIGFKLDYNQMLILKAKFNTPLLNLVIKHRKSFFVNPSYNDTIYSDPLIMAITTNKIKIDLDNYQQVNIDLEDKELSLNKNMFLLSFNGYFAPITSYIFFKELGPMDNSISIPIKELKNQQTILFVNFGMSQYAVEYYVEYRKLENILSNIGGLLGLFFPILESVCGFLVAPFYDASRINSVFNFHTNSESTKSLDELIESFIKNNIRNNTRHESKNLLTGELNVDIKKIKKGFDDNLYLKGNKFY